MADDETKRIGASRKEAIEQGLIRYFGRPCGHGHGTIREVWGRHCVVCVSICHKNRRERYGLRRRELERKRYANNPEKHINKVKEYYVKNCEEVKEKQKRRYHKNAECDEFRKEAALRTKQWALENPEKARANAKVAKHRRRALERNAIGSFTAEDIASIFKAQRGKCAYCRKKLGDDMHVDHIIPLVDGGANDRKNLQCLCPSCNLSKAANDPIDYARKLGKLL